MKIAYYLMGNTCPLNCNFCFWDKRYRDVSTNFKKFIISQIVKAGFKGIILSGGDPAYCKDFLEILKYARSKGLSISAHITGLNITKNKAKEILKYVDIVSLTLDSSNNQKSFIMRKSGNIFNKTLYLIKTFNNLRIKVDIKTLITRLNFSDIQNIGDILKTYKINEWFLLEFVPLNKAKRYKKKFSIPHEEYNSLILKIKSKFPHLNINACKAKDMPEDSCFVNSIGEVYTYKQKVGDIKIGDLNKEKLKNILKKNKL